jgi:hypothetical protein
MGKWNERPWVYNEQPPTSGGSSLALVPVSSVEKMEPKSAFTLV